MNSSRATVVVLDDDPAVLRSLKRLLEVNGYGDVRAFSTPQGLLASDIPSHPSCVLLDQNLGVAKGTDIHAEMKRRGWDLPVIFLTADFGTRTVVSAIREGADDYITKPYDPDELIAAVGRAVRHSMEISRSCGEAAEWRRRGEALTARERLVISLVLSGMINKEIANRLKIAVVTVKVHRARAMRKLGAKNPVELARLAAAAGITPLP